MTGLNDLNAARCVHGFGCWAGAGEFPYHPAAGPFVDFSLALFDHVPPQRRNKSLRKASHSSRVRDVG